MDVCMSLDPNTNKPYQSSMKFTGKKLSKTDEKAFPEDEFLLILSLDL